MKKHLRSKISIGQYLKQKLGKRYHRRRVVEPGFVLRSASISSSSFPSAALPCTVLNSSPHQYQTLQPSSHFSLIHFHIHPFMFSNPKHSTGSLLAVVVINFSHVSLFKLYLKPPSSKKETANGQKLPITSNKKKPPCFLHCPMFQMEPKLEAG